MLFRSRLIARGLARALGLGLGLGIGCSSRDVLLAGTQGIDAAMHEQKLDALLFPGPNGAAIAAKPGYPTVIVPFGMVANVSGRPFPAGFDPKPAPFGVSFTGMACSEPRLLEIAYAFEQATKRRVPPAAVR